MTQVVVTQQGSPSLVIEDNGTEVVVYPSISPSIDIISPGPQGVPGPGFPSGGTTGDILIKVGSGYYDSTWTRNPAVDTLLVRSTFSGDTALQPGQVRWNNREHTLDIGQLRGVVNQLGQETTMVCLNTADVTIGNGDAVMFTGTDEATVHPTIAPMIADGSVAGKVFFGVATEEIAPDEEGYVTIFGKVRDIDTSAFPPDSILWLDPNNPGKFTLTEPEAPALKISAAAVIVSDAASGVILVRADPGQNLSECHDVEATIIGDGQFLGWNDSYSRWEPKNAPNLAPRSITINQPLPGDSFTLFRTPGSTVLQQVTALVVGQSPGVQYELRYATNRTASGTLAVAPTLASVTTSGSTATIQNMPIPSGAYVWMNVLATSGTTNEFNLSIAF